MKRQRAAETATDAAGIYPSLAELLALRPMQAQHRLAGRVRQTPAGPQASALLGRGMDYAESRLYSVGDDARHIDWRVTARTGQAHTKLFQAERERLTLIVADTAVSLYFGTRTRFKSVQAARLGATAVWRALADGDKVAALRGTRSHPPLAPARGVRAALPVLNALRQWYRQPPADDAGLLHAIQAAQRLLRPGSQLIVLADARSIQTISPALWCALTRHSSVVVLLLADVLELSPPEDVLDFSFENTDGDAHMRLDLRNLQQQKQWRALFETPIEQASQMLRHAGAHVQLVRADEDSRAWLGRINQAAQRHAHR